MCGRLCKHATTRTRHGVIVIRIQPACNNNINDKLISFQYPERVRCLRLIYCDGCDGGGGGCGFVLPTAHTEFAQIYKLKYFYVDEFDNTNEAIYDQHQLNNNVIIYGTACTIRAYILSIYSVQTRVNYINLCIIYRQVGT